MNLIAESIESAEISVKEELITEVDFSSTILNLNGAIVNEESHLGYNVEDFDEIEKKYHEASCNFNGSVIKEECHFEESTECFSEVDVSLNFNGANVKEEYCLEEDVKETAEDIESSYPEVTCELKEERDVEEDPLACSQEPTEEEEKAETVAEDVFTLWKMDEEVGNEGGSVAAVPHSLLGVEDKVKRRGRKRKVVEVRAPLLLNGVQKRPRGRPPRSQLSAKTKCQQNMQLKKTETSTVQVKRLQDMQINYGSDQEFCYVCVDRIAQGCSFPQHFDQAHKDSCVCFMCGNQSSSLTAFLNHLNTHSLSCELCNESFVSHKFALLHHKFFHRSRVPLERSGQSLVPVQQDHASSSSEAPIHKAITHLETNQSLDILHTGSDEASFSNTIAQPKQCMKVVTQEVSEVNSEIEGALLQLESLNRKPKSNHVCVLCKKSFGTRQHLRRHEFTHRDKPELCKQCCLSFDTLEELKEHRLNVHAGNLPYVCNLCGLAYEKAVSYRDHMKKIHFGGKKVFQCELCDKVLSNNLTYQTHLRTHSGEKPFKCSICDKSYFDKYSMLKHERLHKTQPVYKCPLCEKTYNRSCLMSEHIKWIHTISVEVEMSNYRCGVCQEELGNADCYLQHVYNHSCQDISYNDVEILIE